MLPMNESKTDDVAVPYSRNAPPKNVIPPVAVDILVVVFSALVGGVMGTVADVFFSRAWVPMGSRKAVSDWLLASDFTWAATQWGNLWDSLPLWVVAFVIGAVTAVACKKKQCPRRGLTYVVGLLVLLVGCTAVLVLLQPVWAPLGPRQAVSDWLLARDSTWAVGHWGNLWDNLPLWGVALVLGVATGILSKKHWLGRAFACGGGLFVLPYFFARLWSGYHVWGAFTFRIFARSLVWKAVAIPLVILGAWLLHRICHKNRAKEVPVALPATEPEGT